MSDVQLVIKKKITAIMPDGKRHATLGITTAASLLEGKDDIPVSLDDPNDTHALKLLKSLADCGGFSVLKIEDGFVLKHTQAGSAETPLTLPQTKVRGGLIVLSPKEVFSSCEKALAHIQTWTPVAECPAKYHQDLTQTFMNGHADGQLHSLFKDLKKYGAPCIMPKLKAFVSYASKSHSPTYSRYNAFLTHGFLPHHRETQGADKRVDASFFKYWLFKELVKLDK